MKLYSLLLLLSLVAGAVAEGDEPKDTDFLYKDPVENAPVIEYLPSTTGIIEYDFWGTVNPKLIEFYNPYCGACQTYKPAFLKLAKALKDEVGDGMEIVAVSCQVHQKLCEKFEIDNIPTVALFKPNRPLRRSSMKELTTSEKKADFIIPYLFPEKTDKRGLEEEGESGDQNEQEEAEEGEGGASGEHPSKENSNTEKQDDDDDDDETEKKVETAGDKNTPEDDDDDDDDDEAEKKVETGDESQPGVDKDYDVKPPLPLKNNVVKGAGASMTKEMISDMERYKEEMKKHHEGQKGVFRRQEPLGVQGAKLKAEKIDTLTGATSAMLAHKPNTKEYIQRKEAIQLHHEQLMKKKNLRTTVPAPKVYSAGAGGASLIKDLPANHKPVLPYKKQIQSQKLSHKVAGKVPLLKHFVVLSPEEELILDASLSFTMALKTGLFTSDAPLSHTEKKAFQGWLDLLRVSLPPEWGLHETIQDLDNNMDYIALSSDNLNTFLSKHKLPRKEWSHSCTSGPSGAQNAFNCGFWKLLHCVSVGVAEHQGGLNLIEGHLVSQEARVFSPNEAAEVMKDFISNFFPCTECINHFVAQYDQCSFRRCVRLTDETEYATFADWQELSKWLWEVHNDVNVRLVKEKLLRTGKISEVRDELKVLYPSLQTCVSCFRGDGGYDEDAVFLYLEKEYWPGASEIDTAADRLLHFHNTEFVGFAKSWALLFVAVGIIYLCRPRGVFKKGPKRRSD